MRRAFWLMLVLVLLVPWTVLAQQAGETVYNGRLDQRTPSKSFRLYLEAGQSLLATVEATSGDLDTVLALLNPSGVTVAENDDRASDTLDSAIGYTAPESGTYTVRVSRYEQSETAGDFRLSITIGDESVLAALEDITRIQLSGTTRTRDTEHFRIHYTLEGQDATSEAYVNALARSVEEIWRIQIEQMGWQPPPSDGFRGGNALYDVYLADLVGQGETALGYTSPEDRVGDNPETPGLIENAATSYIVLENDFDVPDADPTKTISLMRTTMSHEFNHAIQFGYDVDDLDWYYEATATWIETSALAKDQDATGYVEYVFEYPELCFGTESEDAGGMSVYGAWLFIQALADSYGEEVVRQLWENVAMHNGFKALEETLLKYGDDLGTVLANYHVQNLVRQYTLAPVFGATVWRENTINDLGRWTFSGNGIQELAANYFELTLRPGVYYVGLANDDGLLSLWALGVRGAEADAFLLGRGGNIDPGSYDHFYLMVFNPVYDDSTDDCAYYNYHIDISPGKGALSPILRVWDAANFEPLK